MYTYTFRKIQNIVPYEFSELFSVVSSFLLVSSTLSVKVPPFPILPSYLYPSIQLSSTALPTLWSLFTFLTSSVILVMCSHLEMRKTTSEKEHVVCWVSSGSGLYHSIEYFLLLSIYLKISFFFRAEWYSIVQMYHILVSRSSAEEHFNCFYFLVFVNRMQ